MQVTVKPSKANGIVLAPPSKSMAHRLLICAGLSDGESIVSNITFSQDILATLDCLKALGASCEIDGNQVKIKGANPFLFDGNKLLNCRECGSTLRFMIPLCMLGDKEAMITGSQTLMNRPLGIYEDIAKEQNLKFEMIGNELHICGPLSFGDYKINGGVSSQFISGLLFALPLLEGDSTLELIPPVESKPYIDMTLEALNLFGIEISETRNNKYFIKGNQKYKFADVFVEGDYSNSAFLEALNLTGGKVNVEGLNDNSLQGDKVYLDMLPKLKNENCTLDISDCPDLAPILFSVAALCHGAKFTGTKRLKWKESDRASAMKEELSKCGIKLDVGENEVIVYSGMLKSPSDVISSHNDHRIAMAMSVVLSCVGGVIDGAEAVKKSYPDFFEIVKQLGVEVEYIGMDK